MESEKENSYYSFCKSLFDNNFDALMITDFKNLIIDINCAFEKITGYSRDEVIHNNIINFLPKEFHKQLQDRLKELKLKGRVEQGEYEFYDKSGSTKIAEVYSAIVPYHDETAVLSVLRDVTEKRRYEVNLIKEKKFSENIIKSFPGIFYLVEIENNQPLLIKWNDNFRNETMLTDEELYRMNILDFFDEDEKEDIRENIKRALNREFLTFRTVQNPRLKDGSVQRYLYQNVVFSDNNRNFYLGTGINISDKRDLERKLIESVIQTEESERRRIASDLHDGLGPKLSTIKLYIQGLMDAGDENSKKEIGNKLVQLIDNVVDGISEIYFNISPHILLDYGLEASINVFLDKLKIKPDIKITTHFDKIERFGINEELTLYRSINELFHNSLKHASASAITLDINVKNGYIFVLYTDNGNGFDIKRELEKKKGMGIQNMINRVESLEGTFKLDSKLNEGMSARICLPYNKTENE